MKRPILMAAARVSLLYALFAGAWIVLSDRALGLFVRDAEALTRLQTYKGLMFVLVSAGLLFLQVRHELGMRERAQRERERSEARFRRVFESKMIGIHFWDAAGGISESNDAFLEMVGYTRADFDAGRVRWRDLTAPEWRPVDERALEELRATGVCTPFEKEYVRKDGTRVPVLIGAATLGGATDRGVAFVLDDTERKRAELERDRPFTFALDLLCIVGFDGAFRRVNPAFHATLGYLPEEMERRGMLDFVHAEDVEPAVQLLGRVPNGERVHSLELRLRHKSGGWRWLEWTAVPVVEEQRFYAVARDVTEHRRLQEQLMQSQKMEAVGRLAGGVAHDFNNLLTAILGYCEILLSREGEPASDRHEIEEIFKAGRRASALTQQLLAFSRRQVLQPTVVDPNDVVTEMVDMLHRLVGEEIEMVAELAPQVGRVRADRGQLEQAILNLVVNARDAMPAGGRLAIETADVEVSEDESAESDAIPAGRWVRMSVRDTGVGMDTETLAHIFEPFFTTKLRGKGTGLGLATVYGIVEQSSGHIRVRSRPGEGAAFHIYLPRIEAPIETQPAALPGGETREGTETVLLVEDEEGVRRMVERVLRERGYDVLAAGDGESALRLSRERAGVVHLLLSDLVMPGLSGAETADRLRHERSEMRVLFMSGHADERAVPPTLLASGVAFIQKPFTPFALAAKVREVLDGRTERV